EEYGITRIRQGRIEIGRPAINSVCARERGEASIVTAGQKQMRHDPIVSDGQPTLCADRQQRIRQMLRRSNTASCTIDDDPDVPDTQNLDPPARLPIMPRRRQYRRRGSTVTMPCPATSSV